MLVGEGVGVVDFFVLQLVTLVLWCLILATVAGRYTKLVNIVQLVLDLEIVVASRRNTVARLLIELRHVPFPSVW